MKLLKLLGCHYVTVLWWYLWPDQTTVFRWCWAGSRTPAPHLWWSPGHWLASASWVLSNYVTFGNFESEKRRMCGILDKDSRSSCILSTYITQCINSCHDSSCEENKDFGIKLSHMELRPGRPGETFANCAGRCSMQIPRSLTFDHLWSNLFSLNFLSHFTRHLRILMSVSKSNSLLYISTKSR